MTDVNAWNEKQVNTIMHILRLIMMYLSNGLSWLSVDLRNAVLSCKYYEKHDIDGINFNFSLIRLWSNYKYIWSSEYWSSDTFDK